jgi:type VI secretion system protein ImpA
MTAGWDGQELLQPITPDQPCGENLEDTQLLASFDAFRLFGRQTSWLVPKRDPRDPDPEPEPAWGEIRNQALEALRRSKDLRLLAHLGTAMLRTDGLPAFSGTLKVAAHWLDVYWPQTYPLVDEDAIVRRNALNCFADQIAVLDGLRRAVLVDSRAHGRFSLRDVDIAAGQAQPADGETPADEPQINAAFAVMPLENLTGLQQSVTEALAAVKSIDAKMREEVGTEAGPEFDPLSAHLVRIDKLLRAQLAMRPDGSGDPGEVAAAGGAVAVGAIKSRQDAIRALDAVASFFRQNEPSSPIPLIVERAKRLVSKDFLEVLADIAPEAVGQAKAAGGMRDS